LHHCRAERGTAWGADCLKSDRPAFAAGTLPVLLPQFRNAELALRKGRAPLVNGAADFSGKVAGPGQCPTGR